MKAKIKQFLAWLAYLLEAEDEKPTRGNFK